MGLAEVIDRFGTGSYTVFRHAGGGWIDGHFSAADPSTLTIEASVQPQSGRELVDAQEGQHADDVRVLWTRSELRTVTMQIDASEDATGAEADVIQLDGEPYRVIKVEGFFILDSFYRVTCARLVAP